MPIAAHSTTVKVSGVAVAVTGEACTDLGSNVFQITTSARRIMDPSVTPVVKDGGVAVSSALYSVNYLFGKVTFTAPPGGAVTIDYSYLPVAAIAAVKGFSVSVDNGLNEATTFDSSGARKRHKCLSDHSGSLQMLSLPIEDIDPVTGGTQTLADVFNNGTPKLLELGLGSYFLRSWIILGQLEVGAAVEGLVESTVSFEGAPQTLGAVLEISLP